MIISVIVPVFNAENYLHYAMESLEKQTYKNFEIILVNDGSTDDSGKLCDEYSKKYSNVRVFHKENGGLSDARNFGVENANGEFITFLDSDDYFEINALEYLYIVQKKYDVDIVTTILNRTNIYNDVINDNGSNDEILIVDKFRGLEEILYDIKAQSYSCGKLYKKEILSKIKFPLGRIYEDSYVLSEHIYEANKIAICNKKIYHYYNRIGSIVNSPITEKKYDFFEAINHTRKIIISKYKSNKKLIKAVNAKEVMGAFHLINRGENDKYNLLKIKKIIQANFISVLFNRKVPLKIKGKYILFLIFPVKYNTFKNWIQHRK